MSDFFTISQALSNWPEGLDDLSSTSGPEERRLLAVLRVLRDDPESCGVGDVCGLVRTVLRKRAESQDQGGSRLRVPTCDVFPTPADWRAHGCEYTDGGNGWCWVSAGAYAPDWADGEVLDAAPYGERTKLTPGPEELRTDPLVRRLLKFDTYRTPGQADAIRAAFKLASDRPILINLPTGAGKTTVFMALAAAGRESGASTVVVVPTTALAIDLERRFLDIGFPPCAFHAGLPAEVRNSIRSRLRDGTQGVVITSPESVARSLLRVLVKAAESGRIANLCVDEAHLVSGWGVDFRPEFHQLGGLSRRLRAAASERRFRTILLTATVTDSSRRDLRSVFGEFVEVSAVHLRPEPLFRAFKASDAASRSRRAVDAVRNLPRPAIVYTAKVDDAKALGEDLRTSGRMRRVRTVVGGSCDAEETLELWNRGDLDVVVATSAFGLGIDNAHVRTVLHACIPESLDRLYQEVGRGGRDGRPSLGITIWCPEDEKVATGLGKKTAIGLERAWVRWKAMHTARRPGPDGSRFLLNLWHVPPDLSGHNEKNEHWNLRTLLLLQAAGILSLDVDVGPEDEQATGFVPVRVHRPEVIANQAAFEDAIRGPRSELIETARRETRHTCESLMGPRFDATSIFSALYRPPDGRLAFKTRGRLTLPAASAHPRPGGVLLDGLAPGTVLQPEVELAIDDAEELLRRAVSAGVTDLQLPQELHSRRLEDDIEHRAPDGFPVLREPVAEESLQRRMLTSTFPWPFLVWVDARVGPDVAQSLVHWARRQSCSSLVILPSGLTDPNGPQRRLIDGVDGPKTSLSLLMARFQYGTP